MIKKNELRIGNMVNCHFLTTNFNAAVLEVRYGGVLVQDGEYNNTYGYDNISPIELSPEVLEKSGFKGWKRQVNMNMGYEGGDIFFGIPDGYDDFRGGTLKQPKYKHSFILDLVLCKKINEEDYEFTIYYGRGGSKKGLEIKSLHQLQNLYHALSGEELTIQL